MAFTFVNAARVLLTRVDGKFRSWPLTFVNDALTVVNGFDDCDGDERTQLRDTTLYVERNTLLKAAHEQKAIQIGKIINRTNSWLWYIARMIKLD